MQLFKHYSALVLPILFDRGIPDLQHGISSHCHDIVAVHSMRTIRMFYYIEYESSMQFVAHLKFAELGTVHEVNVPFAIAGQDVGLEGK